MGRDLPSISRNTTGKSAAITARGISTPQSNARWRSNPPNIYGATTATRFQPALPRLNPKGRTREIRAGLVLAARFAAPARPRPARQCAGHAGLLAGARTPARGAHEPA